MEHQTANHYILSAALPVVDDNIKTISFSLVSNILLFGIKIAERWASTSTSLTTHEMQTVNNMVTDAITLLAMLIAKFLHREDIDSYKVTALEDATRLFVATSRVGLGLYIVCDSLMSIKFQQSRESSLISSMWLAIITVFLKESLYRKAVSVAKTSESALLISTLMLYRVDAIIGLIAAARSLARDITWLSAAELAEALLLLQSGIVGVVSACASLHDNISKLRIGD